ncbi:DUF502 domain-containing protein [Albibacterium bauzanense]|uniref:Putative membrane protein n=1 Tax=Albibacterium bauzanense TaxID=653929 RepID=A0A4R1LU12_9SPHI|nr:DUF502 domain-containing protein [Albibacterium bauzanense]TCK80749.1 putative membrane protein [Albibacterium bauzanense]
MIKAGLRRIFNYLIKGTIVLLPLVGAAFLIYWLFSSLDAVLNLSTWMFTDEFGNPIYVPGLGIISVLLILIFVGFLITNFVTEPIYNWFGRIINKVPLFNTLYTSLKDFTEAFVGDAKKFNEPVMVEFNDTGLKRIGFLTQRDLSKIGLQGEVMVYFPYAYSFAGQVAIAKAEKVTRLNISATDAMKLVVSGGVSGLE